MRARTPLRLRLKVGLVAEPVVADALPPFAERRRVDVAVHRRALLVRHVGARVPEGVPVDRDVAGTEGEADGSGHAAAVLETPLLALGFRHPLERLLRPVLAQLLAG